MTAHDLAHDLGRRTRRADWTAACVYLAPKVLSLNQKPEQPLLECYEELAQKLPEGLAGLPQLPEELSGAVAAPRSVRA